MKKYALILLAACGSKSEPTPEKLPLPVVTYDARPGLLDGTPQVIVGVIDGWGATRAELRRYERDGAGWREVGGPIAAVIGSAGAAWGAGLLATPAEPLKLEGDLRAPAGAFRLGRAFPEMLGASWVCVDDPESAHYNEVFDRKGVTEDWASAEDMAIAPYRLVVEVEHNPANAPRVGSCIFLHVWDDAESPTAGCTAMAEPDLAALIAWLRPGAVYVLLPRSVRDEVAVAWGLP